MATFVNTLRVTELATGEGSGSWGTTTNLNLELIGEAFSFGTEAITTNADTHTTTIADGASDPGRSMFLKYTGTLDSACTITIGPNTVSKLWFIENATSGSQSIIISQGSGANITIPNGQTKAIYSDGAGSGAAMVDAFQDLSIPDLFVDDDLTVGDDLILSSDSAIIKFGADADTTLTHTDGSGLTLNSTNKLMFNDASQFIQGSSATVLSLGATDEIDLTATAIDVNGTMDVSGALTGTTATFTTADNTAQVALVSTDADASDGPILEMFRNSSSPADDDDLGIIKFFGENDASEKIEYGIIEVKAVDVSDGTEDGSINFTAMLNGTARSRLFSNSTETVFNEWSQDLDFRVESDGNENAIFMEGSTGNTMFGGSGFDNGNLSGSAGGVNVFDATHPIVLLKETTGNTTFYIGKSTSSNFIATEDAQPISISTTDTQRILIEAGGNVTINEPSNDCDFRVESNGQANMFFIDGADDAVVIGNNASRKTLFNTTATAAFQIEGTSGNTAAMSIVRNSNDDNGPQLVLGKSNGTSAGAVTVVTDDALLGRISFQGADGTQTVEGARVEAFVDGTPGADDMPGRLTFSTTADGASTVTERMRITDGKVSIGTTAVASATSASLHVADPSVDVQAVFGDNLSSIDDPQIRVIGRDSANSAIRYLFTGLDADANHGFIGYNAGAGAFVNALTFNTSGEVGIGPNASSPNQYLSIIDTSGSNDVAIEFTADFSFTMGCDTSDAGNFKISRLTTTLGTNDAFTIQRANGTAVFNDSGGAADFIIESDTNANAFFLDSSENTIGMGRAPSSVQLDIEGGSNGTLTGLRIRNSGQVAASAIKQVFSLNRSGSDVDFEAAAITVGKQQNWTTTASTIDSYFAINTVEDESVAERLRIIPGGQVIIGNTGSTTANTSKCFIDPTTAEGGRFTGVGDNSTNGALFLGARSDTTNATFLVRPDGDVENINNTYAALSDQRLKQDIVDAASQWDDIKALKVRKYRFKSDPEAPLQIGVVAQELEEISPGLVEATEDDFNNFDDVEGPVKTVKYSILYMKAIKALQEAMARIETLETKVAALEGGS